MPRSSITGLGRVGSRTPTSWSTGVQAPIAQAPIASPSSLAEPQTPLGSAGTRYLGDGGGGGSVGGWTGGGGAANSPASPAAGTNDSGTHGDHSSNPGGFSDLGLVDGIATFGPNALGFSSPIGAALSVANAVANPNSATISRTGLTDAVFGNDPDPGGGIGGFGTVGPGANDPGVAGVPGGVTGRGGETSGTAPAGPSSADAPGSSSSSSSDHSGDSGGSGAGSRVICTHFHRAGDIPRVEWLADMRWTLEHLSPQTVRGYHAWAIPAVRAMRRGDRFGRGVEALLRPVAVHRAREIGHRAGVRNAGSLRGKLFRLILEPACWLIGAFAAPQDPQSLYTSKETSDGVR